MILWRLWCEYVWWPTQRRIDMQTLWPACVRAAKEHGQTIDDAKAAFAFHAYHDDAWIIGLGGEGLAKFIDDLEG